MSYEAQIDGSDFGTVRGYLGNPRSPILAVLHVKDRAGLAELARQIDAALIDKTAAKLSAMLARMAKDGTLQLSVREGIKLLGIEGATPMTKVPGEAFCEVIFKPPLYLAHTPGLFESRFHRAAEKRAACKLPAEEPKRDLPEQDCSRKGPALECGR